MQIKYISCSSANSPGNPHDNPSSPLRKAVAIAVAIVFAGMALMFSVVLLTIIAIVALFGGAYLWWKTRELRRHLREMPNLNHRAAKAQDDIFGGEAFEGDVIEGEAVRVQEPDVRAGH